MLQARQIVLAIALIATLSWPCAASEPLGYVDPPFYELASVEFKIGNPESSQELITSLSDLAAGKQLLRESAAFFKAHSDIRVDIVGFADKTECGRFNCEALSLRRAHLVYAWLVANGVNRTQLLGIKAFGEKRPIDFSETEKQRQHNRRVEFQIQT